MVIEWLKFRVPERSRAKFLEKDSEIWSSTLIRYHGFINKEVWLNPHQPDEIVLIIRWQSREDWSSVPADVLQQTEKDFSRAMGQDKYQMIETLEYRVS
jgi:uncharacterized protein (TIGR03792 family)